jgi:ribosomal-protein-alanine N-acetyltransferase
MITGSIIVLLRRNIGNARIYSLNVHPEYRRRGIASMLMDSSEKLLREKGFKNITLEVGVNNKPAQSLYHSKGFVMDKTLKGYYRDGGDAYHLIKKL